MSDDLRRRVSDRPLHDRVTVIEVEMRNLGRQLEEHMKRSDDVHDKGIALAEKLDARVDKLEMAWARAAAIFAAAVVIGQVVAPFVVTLISNVTGAQVKG